MNVLILYYSKTGHTLEAVNAVSEGIRSKGSNVTIVTTDEFKSSMLKDYEGLIVGSPCWTGIKNGRIAKPVLNILNPLAADSLRSMRCGGISVHAITGGDETLESLGTILTEKGCEDFKTGPTAKAGNVMSIGKGPSVKSEEIQRYKAFGSDFVEKPNEI